MNQELREWILSSSLVLITIFLLIFIPGCSSNKYDPDSFVLRSCQESCLTKNLSYNSHEKILENETVIEARCICNYYVSVKKQMEEKHEI